MRVPVTHVEYVKTKLVSSDWTLIAVKCMRVVDNPHVVAAKVGAEAKLLRHDYHRFHPSQMTHRQYIASQYGYV
jgi:hypothetical protein